MKKGDLLDFMEDVEDSYLEEVGSLRMNNAGNSSGEKTFNGRKGIVMKLNKFSIGVAVLALIAGIGIGALLFTKPIKGDEAAVELVEKYTPEGEIILPKGTPMTDENAIIVPKEKWEETGLTDPAKYEAIPGGMKEIVKIKKWNIETDYGYETYYSVIG